MIRSLSKKLFGSLFRSNEELLRGVRLIACDLDGTLLNRDDMVAPSTAAMIKLIEGEGVRFIVITRRHHQAVAPYADLIRLTAPIISLDGGLIHFPDSPNPVSAITFDQAFALDIIDEANSIPGVSFCAITPDAFHYSQPDLVLPSYHTHWNIETRVTSNFEALSGTIVELLLCGSFHGVNGVMGYVQEKMQQGELKLRIYESQSNPDIWYLEVRSSGATKEGALARLAEELDIPLDRIIGIGDHYNDIEFCRRVAYVVAMQNAVPELKEIADFITSRDCGDNGINEFLSYFLSLRGVEYNEAEVLRDTGGNRRRSR